MRRLILVIGTLAGLAFFTCCGGAFWLAHRVPHVPENDLPRLPHSERDQQARQVFKELTGIDVPEGFDYMDSSFSPNADSVAFIKELNV